MNKNAIFGVGIIVGVIIATILAWIYLSHLVGITILYIYAGYSDVWTTKMAIVTANRYRDFCEFEELNFLIKFFQNKKIIKSTRGVIKSLIVIKLVLYLLILGLAFIDYSASVAILAFVSGIQITAAYSNIIEVSRFMEMIRKRQILGGNKNE